MFDRAQLIDESSVGLLVVEINEFVVADDDAFGFPGVEVAINFLPDLFFAFLSFVANY